MENKLLNTHTHTHTLNTQVTAVVGGGRDNTVRPALGLAWASLVGSRISLSRDETLVATTEDYCCKVNPTHTLI